MRAGSSSDIDFVITWVDGNDPAWRKEREKYMTEGGDNTEVRYRDWDLLRFWFRAVEAYAPWVRKIHFVTWNHVPDWLDTGHDKLHVVRHQDFIPGEYLPTFNSRTIEMFFHRIPDLAEQFVYFNDDMFLTKPVVPEDFFRNGLPCDSFGLDCICFREDTIGLALAEDIAIINNHFNLRDVLKKNSRTVLSPNNGVTQLFRTLLLGTIYPFFPGLRYNHTACAYLKSSFHTLWEIEPAAMEAACTRFRNKDTVNHFVVKFWQLASGSFAPKQIKSARCFHLKDSNIQTAAAAIRTRHYQSICVNDTKKVTDMLSAAETIRQAFESILNTKSCFEREGGTEKNVF